MSPVRKLLVALGVLAVPAAVAFASTTTSTGDCCRPKSGCCKESAPCCKQDLPKQIVCPITGDTINEEECPLCKNQK